MESCLLPLSNLWLVLFDKMQPYVILWVLCLGLKRPCTVPLSFGISCPGLACRRMSGQVKQTVPPGPPLTSDPTANLESDSWQVGEPRWDQPTLATSAELLSGALCKLTVHGIVNVTDGYCFKSLSLAWHMWPNWYVSRWSKNRCCKIQEKIKLKREEMCPSIAGKKDDCRIRGVAKAAELHFYLCVSYPPSPFFDVD